MRWAAAAVLGGALTLGASDARASEVRVNSRSIGEGYMVRLPGERGQLVGRRRLSQYVNLGVYELLPPREVDELRRDPNDGQLQVVASMRLRHDFGTFTRRASGQAEDLIESLDGRQIDVLYGYLEGRKVARFFDFRLGRQFEMSGLDFYAFDGGWIRANTPAHVAVEAFAGQQVDGTALFGFPTFELDGTQGTPADQSHSMMVGAAVALSDVKFADARFAYRRTWSPTSLNGAIPDVEGIDGVGSVVDQEFISAQVALRLAEGKLAPFGAGRYNLGVSRLDDVSAGVWWAMTDIHTLRAYYLRTIPSFDLDSIFNVFALEPFEDVRVVYQVRPGPRWTVYGRFQGRFFHSAPTADSGALPSDPTAFGGGGGGGATFRTRRFGMRLDGYGLGGEGGVRVGGSVDTRTHVLYDRIAIDARGYALYYADEQNDAREGYSVSLQAGTNVRLGHGVYLNVLAEELFTPYTRAAFRAFGMLSLDWAFRVGQR
ncbi:MAG: hypothetical protein AAGA54_03660 [Myxococcota bacterium]